jgi:hypothetical protein
MHLGNHCQVDLSPRRGGREKQKARKCWKFGPVFRDFFAEAHAKCSDYIPVFAVVDVPEDCNANEL